MTNPFGATVQARLYREQAEWFRRMGNVNAEVASLQAANRHKPVARDVIALPSSVGGKARGGFARAASLSPERRSEIARKAAAARWGQTPATGSAFSDERRSETEPAP